MIRVEKAIRNYMDFFILDFFFFAFVQVLVFERIAASSHVTGLCLHANSVIGTRDVTAFHPSWTECDHRNVLVRTLWDNPILYEEVSVVKSIDKSWFNRCWISGSSSHSITPLPPGYSQTSISFCPNFWFS